MRIFHTILPRSLPRATIKRWINILSLSFTQAFRAGQTCPVFFFSLPHWLAAGQASQHDRAHTSLSSLPSSRKDLPTWGTTFTLLHWFSLTYFEQSAKHHEETSANLWTVGVWEIILSSFIFLSKPMDPRRKKNWIFSTPALTLAS